ncbi:MAG: lysophospholipid acyltransferase family protein [Balneolaceae bacterium]
MKLSAPYVKCLFRTRFRQVWLKQKYIPGRTSRTLYFLNHSSWWDGLIPFLLNRYLFRQHARFMMQDRQMNHYRYFRRAGAFSVNLDTPAGSFKPLRYALESMKRDCASLYVFPEGKITPFTTAKPCFRNGLPWLCRQLPGVDTVPVGIYIHSMCHSRPELHIQIGDPVDLQKSSMTLEKSKNRLEVSLQMQLADLRKYGGFENTYFEKWL